MLGRLWKRKVQAPTQDQLRQAKKLGIKSAAEMSRTNLAVLISEAQRQRAEKTNRDK
jgi:hypothetical protein